MSSEKTGNFDNSLKYLDKAIELNENYYEAFIKKGDILIKHYNKEAGYAANSYYEAIDIKPDKIEAYTKMSWACVELGDYDEALEFCEKGFEVSPNEYKEYYCDKAYILFCMEHYEESIKNIDKYILKYPDNERANFIKKRCFKDLENKMEKFKNYIKSRSNKDSQNIFDFYMKETKYKIPSYFLEFYKKYNGLEIINNDLEFVIKLEEPFYDKDEINFQGFYNTEDIFLNFKHREGISFPYGTLPFVDIELAEICISLREDSFGKVYFVEQDPLDEQLPEKDFESAMKNFNPSENKLPNNMFKITNNFSEFLKIIEIQEW